MTPGQKTTILIADDSLTERQAMCVALEPGGFRILEAADGVAAITIANAERPALVILDVYLPKMNGIAVCRALKSLCTDVDYLPVLMVSSRATVNARLEGLRSGADDFMAKPIEPKELRTRVDALLRLMETPATQSREESTPVRDEWRVASEERDSMWGRRSDIGGLSPVVMPPAPASAFAARPMSSAATSSGVGQSRGIPADAANSPRPPAISAGRGARLRESPNETRASQRLGAPDQAAEAMVFETIDDGLDGVGGHLFDSLTERVEKRLTQEFARARRFSEPLACLVVGVDGYAAMTRRFGEACELELHAIQDAAARAVRQIDLVFELEQGRVLVLLPNTHFIGAVAAAERMWREMRAIRLKSFGELELSASVGVSFFPSRDTQSVRDLVRLAGIALQVAQTEGIGRICLYQHQRYIYTPDAA